MSWARSERLQLYVGQTATTVWAGELGAVTHAAATAIDGLRSALETLPAIRRTLLRRGANVWLAGSLARPFVFDAISGLRRWYEANQLAQSLAPDATGLSGPCDVWLDNWRPGKACLAVAVDLDVRNGIELLLRNRGFRICSLQPWWSTAVPLVSARHVSSAEAAVHAPTARLAVKELESLTILCGSHDKYLAASSYVPCPDETQIEQLLARAGLLSETGVTDEFRAWMPPVVDQLGKLDSPFAAQMEPSR